MLGGPGDIGEGELEPIIIIWVPQIFVYLIPDITEHSSSHHLHESHELTHSNPIVETKIHLSVLNLSQGWELGLELDNIAIFVGISALVGLQVLSEAHFPAPNILCQFGLIVNQCNDHLHMIQTIQILHNLDPRQDTHTTNNK